MRFSPAPPRRRIPLALTPLIDVVFILLLFFLLAARPWHGSVLPLALPPRATVPTADLAPLTIALYGDGRIVLEGAPVTADRLGELVASQIAAVPERRVVVHPAADVGLQQLIDVLERLDAAGVPAPSWE